MLKKLISSIVIFSLLYTDLAFAVREGQPITQDDLDLSPPKPKSPLRRTNSAPSLSGSDGDLQGSPPSQTQPLSSEETSNSEVHQGSPGSSLKDSSEKSNSDQDKPLSSSQERNRSSSQDPVPPLIESFEGQPPFSFLALLSLKDDTNPPAPPSSLVLMGERNLTRETQEIRREIGDIWAEVQKIMIASSSQADPLPSPLQDESSQNAAEEMPNQDLGTLPPQSERSHESEEEAPKKENATLPKEEQELVPEIPSLLPKLVSPPVAREQSPPLPVRKAKKGKKKGHSSKQVPDEKAGLLAGRGRSSTAPTRYGSIQTDPELDRELREFMIIDGSITEYFKKVRGKRGSLIGNALSKFFPSFGSKSQSESDEESEGENEGEKTSLLQQPPAKPGERGLQDEGASNPQQNKTKGIDKDNGSRPLSQRGSSQLPEHEDYQHDSDSEKQGLLESPHGKSKAHALKLSGGDDPEKGNGVVLTIPEDIDPRVLAFLVYAKDYIIDGKFTKRQMILGGVGGTLIGVGVANAMPPIFISSLNGLGDTIDYDIKWDLPIADSIITHTGISLGFDSISRNITIIGQLAGPSTEEFSIPSHKIKIIGYLLDSRKCALVPVYIGASIAALLPVYYLWHVEKDHITNDEEGKSIYLTFFGCLAPTLWLDALFSNGQALKEVVDQKFNDSLIAQAYGALPLSQAALIRQDKLDLFDDLERLFKNSPEDQIHELYEQVLTQGLNIKKSGVDIPEDHLKAADTLRTLKVLTQIHHDNFIPFEFTKTWKKRVSDVVGWLIPTIATAGRSAVFYAIISSLLHDMGLGYGVANKTLSVIFGAVLSSLFQGKVEVDAVKQAVYELLFGEDTESENSYSCTRNVLRKFGKGYNYLQGVWNTLPYILVGIAATQDWGFALQVVSLVFFGLADMFNNTISFNESYGNAIHKTESLLSYKKPTPTYKRNKLIDLVRRYRKTYEIMDPEILTKLNELETKR
jgi:hypothetical protein